jgi:hypothetical protein
MHNDPTAIRWRASIVSDSEFEIIEVDGDNFAHLDVAKAWAREALRRQPKRAGVSYSASVTEGRMVDLGDDDDPDWVFEPADSGRTEYVDA